MNDNPGDLPSDPFSSHDAERIAKETGGQITGRIVWEGVTRLTIGAIERGIWPNLAAVRIYGIDGKKTGEINLGADDVDEMLRGLHDAAAICWPPQPDPEPRPVTDWSQPPPDEDDED